MVIIISPVLKLGGGVLEITVCPSVCLSVHVSGFCSEDIFRTTQSFVTKVGKSG